MTDSTLNRFISRGSAAARAAFTPSIPSPSSGPSQGYFWFEEDTGKLYSWNNTGTPGWQFVTATALTGGDMILLGTSTPSGGAVASFTSISGSYSALKIIGVGRSSKAGTGSDNAALTFNSDTGSNYTYQMLYTNGTGGGQGSGLQGTAQAAILGIQAMTSGDIANYPTSFEFTFPMYADTTFYKSVLGHIQTFNSNSTGGIFDQHVSGNWANTAAITRIDFTLPGGNWAAGSKFKLYGLT